MAAAAFSLKELEDDPRLFLYTSLTAGSSHIITATSRMETILKANRIPFQAIDIATDEKARRLWQRRAGQRKLPGLVKQGFVIGDLNEIEEWNEFGELKENIGPVPTSNAAPPGGQVGVNIAPPSMPLPHSVKPAATSGATSSIRQPPVNKAPAPVFDKSKAIRLPGAEEMAARNKEKADAAAASTSSTTRASTLEAINPETLTSSPEDKKESIEKAKEVANSEKEGTTPTEATSAIKSSPVRAEDAAPDKPEDAAAEKTSDAVEKQEDITKDLEDKNEKAEEDVSEPVETEGTSTTTATAEKVEAAKPSSEQEDIVEDVENENKKTEEDVSEPIETEGTSTTATTEMIEAAKPSSKQDGDDVAAKKLEDQASEPAKTGEASSAATTSAKTEAEEPTSKGSAENVESKETTPLVEGKADENDKIKPPEEAPSKAKTAGPETITDAVADAEVGQEKKTQEQDPKEGEDAAKSVGD